MVYNIAAWNTALGTPFEIRPAPLTRPKEGQVLVKNHAIAVNPVDGKIQYTALYPMIYPTILGQDVAGEIFLVGPGVTRFKVGDRVAGVAVGVATKSDAEKAFQAYTILHTNLTSGIPDSMSFERAAVLGLGLSAASDGLFNPDLLNLQLPTEPAQKSTGKTLLVWGGASSVGSNAIQLAFAAGYEVVTTASPKNFELVKTLGASRVLDYNSPSVVQDLVDAFLGKSFAGAFDAIGPAAWTPILEVLKRIEGAKLLATIAFGFPISPEGIRIKKVFAPSCKDNHIGKAVWEDFLPYALNVGSFVPAPEPLVVGTGLDCLQQAVTLLSQGISARKVVVLL